MIYARKIIIFIGYILAGSFLHCNNVSHRIVFFLLFPKPMLINVEWVS